MCILLLFNGQATLTYTDIQQASATPLEPLLSSHHHHSPHPLAPRSTPTPPTARPPARLELRTPAFPIQATGIAVVDLKRALQSLACAKFKILTKEPKGRDVSDGDAFSFNAAFTCKQTRFKVGTVSAQKEDDTARAETRQKVDEDRKPQIEASIVRGPMVEPRRRRVASLRRTHQPRRIACVRHASCRFAS
jgi:hypothetical protein